MRVLPRELLTERTYARLEKDASRRATRSRSLQLPCVDKDQSRPIRPIDRSEELSESRRTSWEREIPFLPIGSSEPSRHHIQLQSTRRTQQLPLRHWSAGCGSGIRTPKKACVGR